MPMPKSSEDFSIGIFKQVKKKRFTVNTSKTFFLDSDIMGEIDIIFTYNILNLRFEILPIKRLKTEISMEIP